jgi:hypothetical protein
MSKNITEYTLMLGIPVIIRITQKWFLIRTDYYYEDSDDKKIQYLLNISCFTYGIHTNVMEQVPSPIYSVNIRKLFLFLEHKRSSPCSQGLVTKSYPKPDKSKPNSQILY